MYSHTHDECCWSSRDEWLSVAHSLDRLPTRGACSLMTSSDTPLDKKHGYRRRGCGGYGRPQDSELAHAAKRSLAWSRAAHVRCTPTDSPFAQRRRDCVGRRMNIMRDFALAHLDVTSVAGILPQQWHMGTLIFEWQSMLLR
jgi:hypothetical protein